MAWSFGDGFDCYAAPADTINGYWDSGLLNFALATGRFSGSRAMSWTANSTTAGLVKTSSVNDGVHHLVLSIQQGAVLTGTTNYSWLTLYDGATAQCSVVFRSDGAILLTSGVYTSGTTLATYTGALTAINTWYAFEIEIVVHNTTGSITVRKDGSPSASFTLGSLNTRGGTANNYANRLGVGNGGSGSQILDDLFWRSDASSVAWLGDIRCYTRMPATDASVQFARSPASAVLAQLTVNSFLGLTNAVAFYAPVTAAYDGTVSALSVLLNVGYTGSLKCSVFNGTAAGPTTVLSSATTITNPTTGSNAFTFGTPFSVVRGGQYWIGVESDTTTANALSASAGASAGRSSATSYASFPVASPSVSNAAPLIFSWAIATTVNYQMANEAQQDGTTSYVYDSAPGHADFYSIAATATTPATVIAVTTRGYVQKSDAGTRTAAVQLKSGATTVASPTLTLTTSGWLWAWRTDITDPATGSAWTNTAVNNATIGPVTVA